MNKTTTILATLAIGAVSAIAGTTPAPAPAPSGKGVATTPVVDPCAGPISYNNVELLYLHSDFDGPVGDLDGVSLRLEYSPASNFYISASGDYSSGSDTDLWNVRLGLGGYIPLTENIHLVGEVGGAYFDGQTDIWVPVYVGDALIGERRDTVGDSDWGWYVRPHLRAKWSCFEIHAGAEYQDAYENNWAFYGNVYYQVTPGWDLTAGVREGEDSTQWSAGVRYRF